MFSIDLEPSSSFNPAIAYSFSFIDSESLEKYTLIRLVGTDDANIDDLVEPSRTSAAAAFHCSTFWWVAGLTEAQVNSLIKSGVFDWAEVGNTDPIPASKLTNAPSSPGQGGGATTLLDLTDTPENYADQSVLISGSAGTFWGDVDTPQIRDAAVTEGKLADDAVTMAKIANTSVGPMQLRDNAVTEPKLANVSVSEGKIKSGL